jgi:acyl carrier protein
MRMESHGPAREQPLSFAAFASYIEHELGAELPGSSRDLLIGVDLELDSVTMLELVVAIEELGAELPADAFITAKTLGEVYDMYLIAAGRSPASSEASPREGA